MGDERGDLAKNAAGTAPPAPGACNNVERVVLTSPRPTLRASCAICGGTTDPPRRLKGLHDTGFEAVEIGGRNDKKEEDLAKSVGAKT